MEFEPSMVVSPKSWGRHSNNSAIALYNDQFYNFVEDIFEKIKNSSKVEQDQTTYTWFRFF